MNVTPLVDVVLVLLIIFMVVAPQMDQDVPVELPGIFNPDPEVETASRSAQGLASRRRASTTSNEQKYDLDGVDRRARARSTPRIRSAGWCCAPTPSSRTAQVRDILVALAARSASPACRFMVGEQPPRGHRSRPPRRNERGAQRTGAPPAGGLSRGDEPRAATAAKGVAPQMNVTPLVDVVLVLLIIFMVITPLLSKNFWVHTPKQEKEEIEKQELADDPDPPLVLRVGADRNGRPSTAPTSPSTSCPSG